MKEYFFFAACASVAFASCVNDELVGMEESRSKIVFEAPVVSPATRTVPGQITGDYPVNEKFTVWAMWSDGPFEKWADPTNKMYIDRVVCEKNATKNWWNPTTTYYWPKNGYLNFTAYSPSDAHSETPYMGQGTFSYASDGLHIENYRVDPDASKHYDLLYSTRSLDREASQDKNDVTPNSNGVDINFKHALSAIDFKVKRANYIENTTTITLKSIKILNALCTGNFKEGVLDGNPYVTESGYPKWTCGSERATQYTYFVGSQDVTTSSSVITGHNDIILLPQALWNTSDIKQSPIIEVSYTIQANADPVSVTLQVNLADIDGDGNADYLEGFEEETLINSVGDIESWEIGKRYIYMITIGLNGIYFKPYVEEWEDVYGGSDI